MLTTNIDVTYAIIWSLALANILGTAICFAASGRLARLTELRYGILVPAVLAVVFIGAFQGSRSWGDLYTLLAFGLVGWLMLRLGWPRPPLILGIVLGDSFERYLFISIERYGSDWLFRPVVLAVLALAIWGAYRPLSRSIAGAFVRPLRMRRSATRVTATTWFGAAAIAAVSGLLFLTHDWPTSASIVPRSAGIAALLFAAAAVAVDLLREPSEPGARRIPTDLAAAADGETDGEGVLLTRALVWRRSGAFFGWLAGFLLLGAAVGLVLAIPLFIALFSRFGADAKWRTTLPMALGTGFLCWLVFDRLLALPWPQSLLGDLFPELRGLTGFL